MCHRTRDGCNGQDMHMVCGVVITSCQKLLFNDIATDSLQLPLADQLSIFYFLRINSSLCVFLGFCSIRTNDSPHLNATQHSKGYGVVIYGTLIAQ